MVMNGRLIRVAAITADDLQRWRDLARSAIQPNPTFEPECLLPVVNHLPHGNDVLLLIAEDGGQFFGSCPIVSSRKSPAVVSATLLELRRHGATTEARKSRYEGVPLVRAERAVEALRAMLETLGAQRGGERIGTLRIAAMSVDGPVYGLLREAAGPSRAVYEFERWTRPMIRRKETFDYRRVNGRGHESDQNTLRKRRRLSEHLGGDVVLVDRSDDPAAIERLIVLDGQGYKGVEGIAMANSPGEVEWCRETCDNFRREDRLVVHCLEVGSETVAVQLLLRAGDGLFLIHRVYDEQFSKYSPGIQLDLDFLQVFHASDAAFLDSCTYAGNEDGFRVYGDRKEVVTVLVSVGGAVDRALLHLYAGVRGWLGAGGASRTNGSRLLRVVDRLVGTLTRRSR